MEADPAPMYTYWSPRARLALDYHLHGGANILDGSRRIERPAERGEVLRPLALEKGQAPFRAQVPSPSKREIVFQKSHQEPVSPVVALRIAFLGTSQHLLGPKPPCPRVAGAQRLGAGREHRLYRGQHLVPARAALE